MTGRAGGAIIAVAVTGLIALLSSSAATAGGPIHSNGMRDQRYCEIFTVFLSPSPIARVNNTYGLNRCRQGWWESLDASELASEAGAALVLLNGPRYWTMDRVSVTDPGPTIVLAGKELREVATIDLTKVGLAPPPAFTEVKITRDTKFTFRRNRPLFELVDPAGRVYVMQAYSQIIDPELTYDQLRHLRPRVGLPEGWRYRTKKMRRNLALRAGGTATIIQDELKNTYQRLPKRFSE
jgi:hypothetical protein